MNPEQPEIKPQRSIDPERPISPRRAMLVVVLSIAGVLMVGILIRILMEWLGGESEWNSPFLMLELLIVVPVIFVVNRHRIPFPMAFRFTRVSASLLFWAILLGIGIAVIGDQLDRIIQRWWPMPEIFNKAMEAVFLTRNTVDFILIVFIATIGAGVCEEMLFRGFLQRILEKNLSLPAAIIIPAALFGVIHFNPWLIFQISILGAALGVLTWRTNSIYPAILVHSINNLIATLYIRFHTPGFDSYYLSRDLVSPIVVLAAIGTLLLAGRQIWMKTAIPEYSSNATRQ